MNIREKIIVNGLLLMTALFWGSSYTVRKMGLETMGPFLFNSLRFFVASIFVIIVYIAEQKISNKYRKNHQGEEENKNCWKAIINQVAGGVMVGIVFGIQANIQQWGLMTTAAGKVGFINSLSTIFVPLIGWVILKKKIKLQVWLGAGLAFTGLVFISADGSFGISPGDSALLVSAMLFAVQITIIGHFIKDSNPLLLVSLQMFMGALVSALFTVLLETGDTLSGVIAGIGPILYTGLITLGVANTMQFYAQKKASPSLAVVILSFESIFGLIFGMVLLDERMQLFQIIGCLLIFIAVLTAQYEKQDINHHRHDIVHNDILNKEEA